MFAIYPVSAGKLTSAATEISERCKFAYQVALFKIENRLRDPKPWVLDKEFENRVQAAFQDTRFTPRGRLERAMHILLEARVEQLSPLTRWRLSHVWKRGLNTARTHGRWGNEILDTVGPAYLAIFNEIFFARSRVPDPTDLITGFHEFQHAYDGVTKIGSGPLHYLLTLLDPSFILSPMQKFALEHQAIGAQWELASRIPFGLRKVLVKQIKNSHRDPPDQAWDVADLILARKFPSKITALSEEDGLRPWIKLLKLCTQSLAASPDCAKVLSELTVIENTAWKVGSSDEYSPFLVDVKSGADAKDVMDFVKAYHRFSEARTSTPKFIRNVAKATLNLARIPKEAFVRRLDIIQHYRLSNIIESSAKSSAVKLLVVWPVIIAVGAASWESGWPQEKVANLMAWLWEFHMEEDRPGAVAE
ncbi:MAG: hypothetical protein AAB425_02710 [Bdellovibrionota bacterium]